MKSIALVLAVLLISGCFNFQNKVIQLSPGNSKSKVVEVMGSPDDSQFKEGVEVWQYFGVVSFGSCDYRQLWFKESLLIGATSYRSACAGGCSPCLRQIDWSKSPDKIIEIRNR